MNKLVKISLTIILFFYLSDIKSQTIKGTIDGIKNTEIQLNGYNGMNNYFIDSKPINNKGQFTFNVSKVKKGILLLSIGNNINLELIYTGKSIEFKTTKLSPFADIKFINSEENTQYYNFEKEVMNYKKLLNYVRKNAILQKLPDTIVYKLVETADKNFVASTQKQLNTIKEPNVKQCVRVLSYPAPLLEIGDTNLYIKLKKEFFVQMLSDTKLLNDNFLLHTPYLNYRMNLLFYNLLNNTPQKQLINISQKLIRNTTGDNQTFVIDYLQEYFSMNDKGNLLNWMNNFLKQEGIGYCHAADLEKSAETMSKLEIGRAIPDQGFYGIDKAPVFINDINANKTLVIFWRTTCPHCTELMKELNPIYKKLKEKGIEIFAVSIDEDKTEWAKFILKNKLPWLNFIDKNAFDDGLLEKYNILYTPKMYFLDKNKKIISKPETINDIKKLL